MTSFIAAGGSGRSTSVIPAVPAASSVTTIAFIRDLPLAGPATLAIVAHVDDDLPDRLAALHDAQRFGAVRERDAGADQWVDRTLVGERLDGGVHAGHRARVLL